MGFLAEILEREVIDVGHVLAVDRTDHVDRRYVVADRIASRIVIVGTAVQPLVVGVGALVIQAHQQGVANGARLEVRLEIVIDSELADVLVDDAGLAVHVAIGIDGVERSDVDRLEGQVAFGVTQILTELPYIAQTLFEGIAQRIVGAIVEIPIRLAKILMVGDRGAWQFGSLQGQELTCDPGIVSRVLGNESQLGVVVDVPGQAWRDVVALVWNMIDWRVAVPHDAADAV
ncbi:hypothetical protein D3C73_852070 [compost metagenome]